MSLQQLRIGARLGAAFGLVLLVTAMISVIGAWRLGILNDATNNLATIELQRNALAQKWGADINLNWVRTEAFLKAIDRDYMDKLTADTQATAKGMEAKVKRIEALVQGDKAKGLLAAIATARQAYNDKLNEIRELHRGGDLVDRVDEVFFDSLGRTLERLIDDGNWRRIRVQCLSGRKPVRH